MALDYRKCAQEISDNIGGGANVVSAAHCATRLRLVIADNGKVNKEALEEVDGVKGMFESNGQLQLIIGTGTVNKVFDEFIAITGVAAGTKDDVKAAAAAKAPVWRQALKTVGDVFVPILPAIVASGLMMGLVEALAKIPGLGFGNSEWFAFLDTVANTPWPYSQGVFLFSRAVADIFYYIFFWDFPNVPDSESKTRGSIQNLVGSIASYVENFRQL